MKSNFDVTFLLLKNNNFQKRYSVQNVFCEFISCLGDIQMQSFSLPSVEAALKNSFSKPSLWFLKEYCNIFLRFICVVV